ncbi:uncharacterized protein LOC121404109 [Drosophila obscura]|uniref:uncharacterized protein LOC121404109 n=1 Tax=Drosophila obscura TaxID=7282 RepID=UPI001BB1C526|nr:uncharacterized protein LOC121404109 [Drosophila obscura]
MRHFLIFAVLLDVLQLQCMALSFFNLHSLLDKFIKEGAQAFQSNAETTSETKNEIVVVDILLKLCQLELTNRKIEAGHGKNINNNINNINNVIESPTIQQPPITIIIMNNDADSRPYKRRGRLHTLRRKYKWQREYRFVIENDNKSDNSPNAQKTNRNRNGKHHRRANYRSEHLSARTDIAKENATVDADVTECIRTKVEELEKKFLNQVFKI